MAAKPEIGLLTS